MRNVGSLIHPLFRALRALELVETWIYVRQILSQGFGLIVVKSNEMLATGTKHAVVDGHHRGADYMSRNSEE